MVPLPDVSRLTSRPSEYRKATTRIRTRLGATLEIAESMAALDLAVASLGPWPPAGSVTSAARTAVRIACEVNLRINIPP
jgi:hypothetical protein